METCGVLPIWRDCMNHAARVQIEGGRQNGFADAAAHVRVLRGDVLARAKQSWPRSPMQGPVRVPLARKAPEVGVLVTHEPRIGAGCDGVAATHSGEVDARQKT